MLTQYLHYIGSRVTTLLKKDVKVPYWEFCKT